MDSWFYRRLLAEYGVEAEVEENGGRYAIRLERTAIGELVKVLEAKTYFACDVEIATEEGFIEGHDEGYNDGHADGYMAAIEEIRALADDAPLQDRSP